MRRSNLIKKFTHYDGTDWHTWTESCVRDLINFFEESGMPPDSDLVASAVEEVINPRGRWEDTRRDMDRAKEVVEAWRKGKVVLSIQVGNGE